jgi:hypothetical protein
MELIKACVTDGTRAQMPCTVSCGMRSSWHSSRVSAAADLGPPSATLSSPNAPPAWMIVNVSSPGSGQVVPLRVKRLRTGLRILPCPRTGCAGAL